MSRTLQDMSGKGDITVRCNQCISQAQKSKTTVKIANEISKMILRIREPFQVYYHGFQEIIVQAHKEIQVKVIATLGSLR